MDNIAFLSLGTNIGDRQAHLQRAIERLSATNEVDIVKMSSIYETDPVGYEDQDPFLNMAIKVVTSLTASDLLQCCMTIESEMGRVREVRWGPRIIDLDILLYNKDNIVMDHLQVPHPRMTERAFVLVPLLEMDRGLTLPVTNAPLAGILDEIPDREGVRLWKQINGEEGSALFEN